MRGVWIEIFLGGLWSGIKGSLPMRGVWIEIIKVQHGINAGKGHSPCGECGLKSAKTDVAKPIFTVTPHAGSVD